jgi:hypothetical protein
LALQEGGIARQMLVVIMVGAKLAADVDVGGDP